MSFARRSFLLLMLTCTFLPFASGEARQASKARRSPLLIAQSASALTAARKRIAANDSAGAVEILRAASAADPDNGPLWFEYGSLLSANTRYAWRRGSMPAGVPQIIIAAETSLARATRLAPDSVHYAMTYARHLAGAHTTSYRRASMFHEQVVERAGDDSSLVAESADQLGIILWRQFEPLIGKGLPLEQNLTERIGTREDLIGWVRRNYRQPKPMFGIALYEEALRSARTARETNPAIEAYFRHEMMMLAELARWQEMEQVSRLGIRAHRQHPWPWLVLGLAEQRRGRSLQASAAFDSGFARLPDAERHRLESAMRHMLPKHMTWYDTLSQTSRNQLGVLFWNNSNPSYLQPGNAARTEFVARVVYAELRFTDEAQQIHGSSSDRGEIYIRYGPPDVVMRTAEGLDDKWGQCNFAEGIDTSKANIGKPEFAPDCYNTVQMWVYYNDILLFRFGQNRGNGNARQMKDSRVLFDSIARERPTGFSNVPLLRHRVDSISSQIVRFRAADDSIDYAIYAGVRAGALRRDTPLESSSIKYGVFLVDPLGRELMRTAATINSAEKDSVAMTSQNNFLRTATNAASIRLEALEPDLLQAARTIVTLPRFTTRGFGTSELLVARSVTPPSDKAVPRWSDYAVAPFVGNVVPRGEPISLIWENYEPAAANGTSRLRIAVSVQRETNTGLVAVAGRVLGGVREALTGNRPGNEVGISYLREFTTTPVTVDHLKVDLGTLEPGRYQVKLIVVDLVTNSSVEQSQRFVIVR
jgi:GWxTD domain-containing protein